MAKTVRQDLLEIYDTIRPHVEYAFELSKVKPPNMAELMNKYFADNKKRMTPADLIMWSFLVELNNLVYRYLVQYTVLSKVSMEDLERIANANKPG